MPIEFIRHKAKAALSLRGLIFKAFIFGLGWLLLPFWMFLLVALYLYLVPFFQPFNLIVPYIMTIAAAAALPYGLWFAIFLGVLFFLLVGIKNLILVNRFENHQLMVFLLFFLLFFGFFSGFENWQKWTSSAALFGVAAAFFLLFRELADYYPDAPDGKKILVAGIGSVLIWQAASAIIFLPLNYFYQTAILFLAAIILTDILLEYLVRKLDRKKILWNFSVFFALMAAILASANWGL